MKIMFYCIPAHGHTNPTLGVVKELIKNGQGIYYYFYENMKKKNENSGAKFISCDKKKNHPYQSGFPDVLQAEN